MTAPEKADRARGWEYVEDRLAAGELERLEKLSDAELDAELEAAGLDVKALPTAAELVALGAERARRPDAARGWKHVEKLLAQDEAGEARDDEAYRKEVERLEAMGDEALDAELRGAGLDVGGLPTGAEIVAKGAEARAKVVPLAPPRRASRAVSYAAAAAVILLAFFAFRNRRAVVAWWNGEPIRPDDQWLPWKPGPTPHERAEALRDRAVGACYTQQWRECRAWLDDAKALDPDGEGETRVVEARRAMERAEQPDAQPPDKPEQKGPR
ncbi:MAG TPA: hypothetical protein VIF09_21005 [Polyangiaceae bacterium]